MIKRQLRSAVTHPTWLPLWRCLRRRHAAILAWHRFTDDPSQEDRFPVDVLRRQLELLRRDDHEVVSLPTLIQKLDDPDADLSRMVALTVDDGYHDFADLAADVFLAYDCPVTTFLTSGFLDKRTWMWWDQVDYCVSHAGRTRVQVEVAGQVLDLDLTEPARRLSTARLWAALKQVPSAERLTFILDLAARFDLVIPDSAPPGNHAMRWDQVRSLSRRGLRFAPHTVTHPILSRSPGPEAAFEIEESWRRVSEEEPGAEAVFAYPNGLPSDFTHEHVDRLERLGFLGAVTMVPRYASDARSSRYELPRFPATVDSASLLQVLSGAERAIRVLRGRTN
jgi:peptidoglycan/xylan/chitin deacetylase (PgdA/CDA1 family)